MLCGVIGSGGNTARKKREKMRKTELTPEQVKFTADLVAQAVNDMGGTFQVIIHSTSTSNLSYTYSVYLWYFDGEKVSSLYLNYWLAFCMGKNLTDTDRIKGSGLGFSRADYALEQIKRILDRLGFSCGDLVLERTIF